MKYIFTFLLMLACLFAPATEAAEATWTACAAQNGTCNFTGTRSVRYGTTTQYVSKKFSTSAACNDATFGDPAKDQVKSCFYSSVFTCQAGCDTGSGGAPTWASIQGKPLTTGTYYASSNEVIENRHFQSNTGNALVIPRTATNVTIRNNEFGPCGLNEGSSTTGHACIFIDGATNFTIQRNVFHDAGPFIFMYGGSGPFTIDRNMAFNPTATRYLTQFLQFNGMRSATGPMNVSCNLMDGRDSSLPAPLNNKQRTVEDHFSAFNTAGTPSYPLRWSYNSVRGMTSGGGRSGTGFQASDAGFAEYLEWIGNTVVQANGIGISIHEGCNGCKITNNIIAQEGENAATMTSYSVNISKKPGNSCAGNTVSGNRATTAIRWAWDGGAPYDGIYNGNPGWTGCTYTESNNNWNDAALEALTTDQIWATYKDHAECGGTQQTYTKTQIYALGAALPSTAQGANVTLNVRFYGVAMPNDVKMSLWLQRVDTGAYTLGHDLLNHYTGLNAKTWNGYRQYDYANNVTNGQFGTPVIPTGDYKIIANLYEWKPPYASYVSQTECNGVPRVVLNEQNGQVGCHIGNITVTAGTGQDPTWSSQVGTPAVITGNSWAGP